jgi:RimJ/RimL family protein N-acetyltransferase
VTTIETERLILRRWRETDVVPLSAINADPEVMRWIGDGTTRSQEQTRASIGAWQRAWDERGFGLFAVEVRATGELAGLTGLAVPDFLPEVLPAVEIGWRFGRQFWSQGLGTEAARAALRFGLVDRDLDRIISIIQVGNGGSERIAQKLGMTLERETIDPNCARPVRVYDISKPDHLAGPPKTPHLTVSVRANRGKARTEPHIFNEKS